MGWVKFALIVTAAVLLAPQVFPPQWLNTLNAFRAKITEPANDATKSLRKAVIILFWVITVAAVLLFFMFLGESGYDLALFIYHEMPRQLSWVMIPIVEYSWQLNILFFMYLGLFFLGKIGSDAQRRHLFSLPLFLLWGVGWTYLALVSIIVLSPLFGAVLALYVLVVLGTIFINFVLVKNLERVFATIGIALVVVTCFI